MSMESHGGILTGKMEEPRQKPAPVSLCPPQIMQTELGLRGERQTINHLSHGTASDKLMKLY